MIDWRESKKKKNEEIHWRERERESTLYIMLAY
jgi:hypothetical protein